MKKVLCVLFVLLIVGGALFAGGGKAKGSVTLWGHVDTGFNNGVQAAVDKFNAQSDAKVKYVYFPWEEYEAKVMTSLTSGKTGADIYFIWGAWVVDFVAAGTLAEVPGDLVRGLLDDAYEPCFGTLYNNNRYYGLPVETNIEYGGLLVNKKEFNRQGIAYPKTWDEIIDVAKRTTVKRGNVFDMRGFDFTTEDTLTTFFLHMIMSKGGQYWDGRRLNFNTPQAAEAFQTLLNWVIVDGVTNTDSITAAQGIADMEFLGAGQAMMVPRGAWAIPNLEADFDLKYGVDFEYISIPAWDSGKNFPAETGWSVCVPKNSKNPDAAWAFAEFFMRPANLMEVNISGFQVPPLKSITNGAAFRSRVPAMAPILEILDNARYIGAFNTEVLKRNLTQTFDNLCQPGANTSRAGIETALRTMTDTINRELF